MDIKVLFVCMGNICRSPTAQGVFEEVVSRAGLADRIQIDSAGTHAYHVGELPDPRARAAAAGRGYDLSRQRARRLVEEDLDRFDYVVVMDEDNLQDVHAIAPPQHAQKVVLFMSFAPTLGSREVPDPYYGATAGFERVLDMVEHASQGLLDHIRRNHIT
jgi:protein-tyrosine phosphatase